MPMPRRASITMSAVFLAVIVAPGLIQTISELREGEQPRALDVFQKPPTARNLHAYERSLEETSLVVKRFRPWMQYLEWRLLGDAGEKVVVGRNGWLFYRQSVGYVVERPTSAVHSDSADPLAAIRSFRDQLAARGIRLLVVPVPNKESVYPEMLARRQRTWESSSASRRVVCSISWNNSASSTSTCLRYFAVSGRWRRGRIRAALPGAGQPLVAGGCTVGRHRYRAASARTRHRQAG